MSGTGHALALLWLLFTAPERSACMGVCEVLDFEFVREERCACVCWDVVTKDVVVTSDPRCLPQATQKPCEGS